MPLDLLAITGAGVVEVEWERRLWLWLWSLLRCSMSISDDMGKKWKEEVYVVVLTEGWRTRYGR